MLTLVGLERVDFDPSVVANEALTTLDGLKDLERVEGAMWISGNESLCQSEVDAFIAGREFGQVFMSGSNGPC